MGKRRADNGAAFGELGGWRVGEGGVGLRVRFGLGRGVGERLGLGVGRWEGECEMDEASEFMFDHEKLEVYRESLAFVAWVTPVLEEVVRAGDVKDQLDRASTSILLNLAEGNGKYTLKDRCRFFDNAHGSALECAGALDILVAKEKASTEQMRPGKARLVKIVRMLMGLIKRNSDRDYGKSTE